MENQHPMLPSTSSSAPGLQLSFVHRSAVQIAQLTRRVCLQAEQAEQAELGNSGAWVPSNAASFGFQESSLHPCSTWRTMTRERSVQAATMEPSGDALNANTAKETTRSPKAFRFTRVDSWSQTSFRILKKSGISFLCLAPVKNSPKDVTWLKHFHWRDLCS